MKVAVRACCVVWCLAISSSALAEGYEEYIDDGVHEFDAGNFVEARALFEQAHALSPNARTLRAMGFCAYELKRYVQASEELSAALLDQRNALTPELAATVRETLAKARRFIGELVLQTQPEDSRVVIDGEAKSGRRYELDAGEHRVVASARGYSSRDLTVAIHGMQTTRAELVLVPLAEVAAPAPAPAPAPVPASTERPLTERWWFWTALGVIVTGVTVSVLVVASSDHGAANAGTTGVTLHAR
ncbi:MAG TPA: tetratricopeptide repeat protein [Polyangiales bacterium]|nr:tetratricopeptide repeat protein [Polyangiales bacterium]